MNDQIDLRGKIAVVTGVGAGIGAAVADVFSLFGAKVVGLECNAETLGQTAQRVAEKGGEFHPICTDVASELSVQRAFGEIERRFGSIDVLVNNAGVEFYKEFVDVQAADWENQLAVNLRSVFLCCSKVAPFMIRARRGSIVNTASVQAFATTGQTAPYAAAKAGVLGFTRDLARDLGPYNIRVNGICPGCIDTPMMARSLARSEDPGAAREKMGAAVPLRRLGNPREIANAAAFLCSDLASYISGVSLLVDGGLMAQLPVT
jgi:NAD(P)-dependent dehydrogenase (short-subunit alcohol dehydrogenase family)